MPYSANLNEETAPQKATLNVLGVSLISSIEAATEEAAWKVEPIVEIIAAKLGTLTGGM